MKKLGIKLVCLLMLLEPLGGILAAADQVDGATATTNEIATTTSDTKESNSDSELSDDLENFTFSLSETTYTYDGTAKKPKIMLSSATQNLTEGTDFSVTYLNNVNVGTATVRIEGKGNFKGALEKEFKIMPQNIGSLAISLSAAQFTFDGNSKEPSIIVKSGHQELVKNQDYRVSYSNNVNVGTARVMVTGQGNYSGMLEKTFQIKQRTFNVKFDSKGGSSVDAQTVTAGNLAKTPKAPTRKGYQFAGWYGDSKLTKKYNFKTKIAKNQTLFAKWNKKYTVKFNSKSSSKVSAQSIVKNDKVTQPKTPKRKNYIFVGWYSNSKLTKKYNFKTAVKNDFTLHAKWRKAKKLTITFQSKGGSKVAKKSILERTAVAKPKNPKRTGYKFVGWYSDKKLKKAYNFKSAVKKNKTLYAKWSKNKYSVGFNSNKGSAVKKQTVTYKSKIKKPKNPSRKGYRFAGWYSDKKLKKTYNFKTGVTKNQTLYAKWTKNKVTHGKPSIVLNDNTTVYRVGGSEVYHVRKHLKKGTKYKAMTYKQAKKLHLRHCRANGCK